MRALDKAHEGSWQGKGSLTCLLLLVDWDERAPCMKGSWGHMSKPRMKGSLVHMSWATCRHLSSSLLAFYEGKASLGLGLDFFISVKAIDLTKVCQGMEGGPDKSLCGCAQVCLSSNSHSEEGLGKGGTEPPLHPRVAFWKSGRK